MTRRLDPTLAAIEQRLERASQPTAAPGLRPRVLAAVSDVLHEKAPATLSGRPRESLPSFRGGLFNACVVSAIAAFIAFIVIADTLVLSTALPLSLDARARIAGVRDETLAIPLAGRRTTDVALRQSPAADASTRPVTLRVLDTRRILQETL